MLTRNSNFTRLLFNRHEKNWQYKPRPRNLIVFALHMRLKIVCCTQWDECNYLSIHAYYVRVYDKKDCCNCSLLVNDTMNFFLISILECSKFLMRTLNYCMKIFLPTTYIFCCCCWNVIPTCLSVYPLKHNRIKISQVMKHA